MKRYGLPSARTTLPSAQITSGQFPPFIMVMPQERGLPAPRWVASLSVKIVPYIDSRYRTLAARSHRAIGGITRSQLGDLHLTDLRRYF